MTEEELIPEPEEEKPEEDTGDFNPDSFREKLAQIKQIMEVVQGGETVGARVSPILAPSNPRTTSILNRGEIEQISAFLQFAPISPEETYPIVNYVHDKLALNLSLDGKGIGMATELGKALTVRDSSKTYTEGGPGKPTEGMK
jgi:hypothetical protein